MDGKEDRDEIRYLFGDRIELDTILDKIGPNAEWSPDCQGNWDYDGPIISLSVRYWPRGGGFDMISNSGDGEITIQGNDERPDIKPSATASIQIDFRWLGNDQSDWMDLVKEDFEGETEAEVKAKVEEWTKGIFRKVCRMIGGSNDL